MTRNFIKQNYGFSLIETLFSMLIITIVLIFITNIIGFGFQINRRSFQRLQMEMHLENTKGEILGKAFGSDDVTEGGHSCNKDPFHLRWEIKDISSSLKRIEVSVKFKKHMKRLYFYKSKYIMEVKND